MMDPGTIMMLMSMMGGGDGKKKSSIPGTAGALGVSLVGTGLDYYFKRKAMQEQRKEDLRAEGVNRYYKDMQMQREAGQSAWTRRVKENEINYSRIMDFTNSLNGMFSQSQNAASNIQQMLSQRRR